MFVVHINHFPHVVHINHVDTCTQHITIPSLSYFSPFLSPPCLGCQMLKIYLIISYCLSFVLLFISILGFFYKRNHEIFKLCD